MRSPWTHTSSPSARSGRTSPARSAATSCRPRWRRSSQRIEGADLLIVASPVYRASFTGLFKHLFDFVGQYALVDKPVLMAATGGSDRHALIIEHQFRPLFGFFQALTLPIGVYANDSDFTAGAVSSLDLHERIDLAVARSLPLIRSNVAEAESIAKYLGR